MIIAPVDSKNDLFVVRDFYPQELLSAFIATNHLTTPFKKEELQNDYSRSRLVPDADSVYQALDAYTKQQLITISQIVNVELMACDTGFWLDHAGFSMEPHVDNPGVSVSMQLYLNENLADLGTVFYNTDRTVRYAAKYELNTGYLMINGPQQLHGMSVPVPDASYRISSYTWFYPKT